MMRPTIHHICEGNPYYAMNTAMFNRLVALISEYPFSFSQMLRSVGKRSYVKAHPDYVPPYRDLYEWVLASTSKLNDPFFKLSTRCHWILNGIEDFPTCKFDGCHKKLDYVNVAVTGCYHDYCLIHAKCNDITQQKHRDTCMRKYGVQHHSQSDVVKAHAIQTNIERHGVAYVLASEDVRQKAEQTKIERYGDPNYNNHEKTCATKAARYGDPHYSNSEKAKQTSIEKYGVSHYTNREKAYETRCNNHNGQYWTDIMLKRTQTTKDAHRAEDPDYDEKIKSKIQSTNLKRYGSCCYFQSKDAKRSLLKWIVEHGGANNVFQTDVVKAKSKETMLEHFGVEYAMQSQEVKVKHDFIESNRKGNETKRLRGTFNTSKPEDRTYDLLTTKFGAEDIKRQYKCERYPFSCDFYIKSFDLFIECNYHWTHGKHWFDPECKADLCKLEELKAKAARKHEIANKRSLYDVAIYVWTELDSRKQLAASNAQLNYIVFWNEDEARDWIAHVQKVQ